MQQLYRTSAEFIQLKKIKAYYTSFTTKIKLLSFGETMDKNYIDYVIDKTLSKRTIKNTIRNSQ